MCDYHNLCNPTLFLVLQPFKNTLSISYDMAGIILGFKFKEVKKVVTAFQWPKYSCRSVQVKNKLQYGVMNSVLEIFLECCRNKNKTNSIYEGSEEMARYKRGLHSWGNSWAKMWAIGES